ncbi:uncharacterized protein I303_102441 [Kwoniella dejecticola CBS 10117]|uniref:Uncharacterized protein n=1 Tax=Kwoniella dejecticola CBS 10117 TaxID=1296121 RepID=A0A1A6A8R3_9TREE|nr:uncharacterized protein I303_02456 [Kwoniella dejecticola CBS 10117]OBR86449.1 hypothetical protein I303_02456 [Kwoniella dejecticola CBS 10117]
MNASNSSQPQTDRSELNSTEMSTLSSAQTATTKSDLGTSAISAENTRSSESGNDPAALPDNGTQTKTSARAQASADSQSVQARQRNAAYSADAQPRHEPSDEGSLFGVSEGALLAGACCCLPVCLCASCCGGDPLDDCINELC